MAARRPSDGSRDNTGWRRRPASKVGDHGGGSSVHSVRPYPAAARGRGITTFAQRQGCGLLEERMRREEDDVKKKMIVS